MNEENKKCKKCGTNDAPWLTEGLCDDCYDSRHESTNTSEEIKQREREREREQSKEQYNVITVEKKPVNFLNEKMNLIVKSVNKN